MCHLDVPQDVVIILDSSTSIARPDFSKQLRFLSDFVNQFKIGPQASQVGVISFSNNEVLNFHLNRYATKAELQDAILKIKQIGGGTNTHKPLEYVRTKMFVPAGGDRPDVRNLCIVITDGQSSNPAETAKQAKLVSSSAQRHLSWVRACATSTDHMTLTLSFITFCAFIARLPCTCYPFPFDRTVSIFVP